MRFSIIVPCYNEADNIPLLFKRFSDVIGTDDIEVLFVNNGSTDNSAEIFQQYQPKYSFSRVVTVKKNRGYGFGIYSGLKVASGEFIGWTHADMQTDPADVIKACKIIKKNKYATNIYVKGLRRGRPAMDVFFTVGMSIFETLFMKIALWDINAQPNMFHRTFFKTWTHPPKDFSFDLYTLYLAKKQDMNIMRFKVIFPERIHGASKWNTGLSSKIKFIIRTVLFSLKLKKGL